MASIMRVSPKSSLVHALLYLCLLVSAQVSAGKFNATIEMASLIADKGQYKLAADVHFPLSPIAVEALQNSISLVWNIRLKIFQQRAYLWDKELLDRTLSYRVRYHALLNMYQVKNEGNGEIRRFFSQSAAFSALGKIRNLIIVEQAQFPQTENLWVALKVQLDREALPLPLRPIAYFDQQWDLSSDWLQWQIEE